jgi:hypothetical protein
MKAKRKKPLSDRDIAFWRAYFEISKERVPLVDHWDDGSVTWHPRVVRKMLWYTETPDTMANRRMAVDWLMANVAVYTDEEDRKNDLKPPARNRSTKRKIPA